MFFDDPVLHGPLAGTVPILRALLHSYRATAADMAPSLAVARTVHARPAFHSARGVTLHVPRRLYCDRQHTSLLMTSTRMT